MDQRDHCSEEDLILHYYGEHPRAAGVQRHLDECPACRHDIDELASTLALAALPEPPARGDSYGLEVWHRIRHRLPEPEARPGWRQWFASLPAAGLAAAALLVLAAFIAGRSWPDATPAPTVAVTVEGEGIAPEASERVRLAALSQHFERSEHMLLDLVNAGGLMEVGEPQARAADLLAANRLYREASSLAGDAPVADVLDELERVLIDLVHGPAVPTPEQIDQARLRLDAAALLFKVRVLSDTLRDRERDSPAPRTTI